MPAFGGMGARLKKPEKLQGINRSHLIKIPQHPNVPAEWPGWYYPKKLIVDNCSGKYGSIIPEQGQFHVSLYAVEDTVVIFKHLINCSPLCLGGFSKVKRKPLYGLSKSEPTPRRLRCYKPACTTEYIQMIDHRINIHVELLVLVS